MRRRPLALAPLLFALPLAVPPRALGVEERDPRAAYDVLAYRLDLALDPEAKRLEGTVALEARALEELALVRLDLSGPFEVTGARLVPEPLSNESSLEGTKLRFRFEDERLDLVLPERAPAGAVVRLAVDYAGEPRARDGFTGFHWSETEDGRPWIATSCQMIGAHSWWPCKASFYHPADKPERVLANLDVPAGLVAVANGRLVGREERGGRALFRWRHDYPLMTYSVALNVGPYVEEHTTLELPGLERPLPVSWWVLPEHAERAAVQFAEVPRLLAVFGEAFGPFPFPDSKFALVETPFWGMEHSTAIAYGSSFPAWLARHGGSDPYASRDALFDYILVHESAHEWWGNAVSAADWRHFWLHEGFASYAEVVFVERTQGREAAERWLATMRPRVGPRARLVPEGPVENSQRAYSNALYDKGALVLETLRWYLADDEAWWRALRRFQAEHRYGSATTDDFRRAVEAESGLDLERFFLEWVLGEGWPKLEGSVRAGRDGIVVDVACGASGATAFHVPLDLVWRSQDGERRERLWLDPGRNRVTLAAGGPVEDLRVVGLERLLGRHEIEVR
jgi:aminopeptidase N